MPKVKSHRGAAKRFSMTGTGLVKRAKANKSHILNKKNRKRKRNLRQSTTVSNLAEARTVKVLLPYK